MKYALRYDLCRYNEISEYDWEKPAFNRKSAHFTQMVWKSNKRYGVGIKQTEDKKKTYIVARYAPGGNVNVPKQFAENVMQLKKKD